MKLNWNNILFTALCGSLVFLYGFANHRNETRKLKSVQIEFAEVAEFFIEENDVYKLLIQSNEAFENLTKESVDLKVLEANLENNEMIKDAQVFLSIDGVLGAEIEQRKPILRFLDGGFQYLDEDGLIMPLSNHYSARVPVAFGFNSQEALGLFPLARAIHKDVFLKQQITALHQTEIGEVYMEVRDANFKVDFGDLNNIDLNLANFKAFFA